MDFFIFDVLFCFGKGQYFKNANFQQGHVSGSIPTTNKGDTRGYFST
jgi:hypothetical protein